MRIPRHYDTTLAKYLKYRTGGFLRPSEVPFSESAPDAKTCMFAWETHGHTPAVTSEPSLLADYIEGKKSRDWHISEWRSGVTDGYLTPIELLGTLGVDEAEFYGIFGHQSDCVTREEYKAFVPMDIRREDGRRLMKFMMAELQSA